MCGSCECSCDFEARVQGELFEDVVDVALDRVRRKVQPLRDLLVAESFRDQVYDFAFRFVIRIELMVVRFRLRAACSRSARRGSSSEARKHLGSARNARIVFRKSWNVASLRTNPDAPALTYSISSSWTGARSMMMIWPGGLPSDRLHDRRLF